MDYPHPAVKGTGKPPHAWKLRPQIQSQTLDHLCTPAVPLLALESVPAYPPVESDQLGIDGQRGSEPGFPDPGLQLGEPRAVAGSRRQT